MDEELERMLKYIRLPGLLANWNRYLTSASQNNYSHTRLLKEIIRDEYATRQENSRKLRIRKARMPEHYVIETFPFERQPNLSRKRLLNIYDSNYMEQRQNIIWIGATGTGKTGLATSFLMQAINQGHKGRFIAFPDLVELLYQSVADHTEAKVLKLFEGYDSLLIDELGYVEVEPIQVGLFFTLMQRRHKKKTTLITSNLGFSQWSTFLKNDQLTAALIDRLTENSHVINMKNCVSLRAKLSTS